MVCICRRSRDHRLLGRTGSRHRRLLTLAVGQRGGLTGKQSGGQKLKALAVLLAGPAPTAFTATTW
jgi:hypothetical protein